MTDIQVFEKTKPDLILINGDIVYGEFDDSGRIGGTKSVISEDWETFCM